MDNVWNGWKTNGSNWSIASRESSRGRIAHAGPLTSQNTVDTRVNTDAQRPEWSSACIGCFTFYVDLNRRLRVHWPYCAINIQANRGFNLDMKSWYTCKRSYWLLCDSGVCLYVFVCIHTHQENQEKKKENEEYVFNDASSKHFFFFFHFFGFQLCVQFIFIPSRYY